MEGPGKLFPDLQSGKRVASQKATSRVHEFHSIFQEVAKAQGKTFVWGGLAWSRAKQLQEKAPDFTPEKLRRSLNHWLLSDVNHAEMPEKTLLYITEYELGPLDYKGKPKGAFNATSQKHSASHGYSKSDRADEELAKAGVQRPSRQTEAGPEPDGVVPRGRDGCGSPGVILEGNRFFVQ